MIYSMTAFARSQKQQEAYHFICEMRSINHRYLEISVYLPDALRTLEMAIRDCLRQTVKRGKIECTIRYQHNAEENTGLSINMQLAKELCAASEKIAGYLQKAAPIHAVDILRFPGVLAAKEADVNNLQKEILHAVQTTLKELVAVRAREGEELKKLFLQRIELIEIELAKVKKQLPTILVEQRERMLKRFSEIKLDLDEARLEQEMVIFTQRIDVAEELDRLQTHLLEIRRILQEGGVVGRRLDFLLQELNREANTLGSKSVDPILNHAAVISISG